MIFPLVDQDTLRDLRADLSREGSTYRERVQRMMHRSYGGQYRRMVAPSLELLAFRSHTIRHQPRMHALDLFTRYAARNAPYYDRDEVVPLDGVVPAAWRDAVIAPRQRGPDRIRRVPYEICVLQALRETLRCKEIWVVGANRYRDPDHDVPQDFAAQRARSYQALQLPLNADTFIQTVQQEHAAALEMLNAGMPTNREVRILDKDTGWIEVSPLTAQPEPPNLTALKQAVNEGWMLTELLDMLKETALLTGCLKVCTSVTDHERMDRATLEQRLLLCLYGLGTNTGLRRMRVGNPDVSEKDLRYIRRRFITTDHLRTAIACVVNAILTSRLPDIWGDATTACASDSKKFGAWDQNLITEWHTRYRGRGVVIYWHVEKKAACFHSQRKTCASSDVAAAMTGVIHHCTAMAVDKHYVDSHGQSEVAFGFCRLLGYHVLLRLKPIHSQKLYLPTREHANHYPHLQHSLTRSIDWELIRQQYDEMVTYASALQQGTAEAEAILARFTRNAGHPTYKSTAELGRVEKAIFLCHYLHSEALRREINEGLNVVENWNSANSFIFYGRHGERSSHRREDQEVAMLCVHLLHIAMVYSTTLIIQDILRTPAWQRRLMEADLRGLTPLINQHVNPYGVFVLDMERRLPLAGVPST